MNAQNSPTPAEGDRVVDLRALAPRDRHALVFDTFASLAPGQAMLLINDHEPRPLYYQFRYEHAGQFEWTYLEERPDAWQVRITRMAAQAATS